MTNTLISLRASEKATPEVWLSILVPVYQVESYLKACAESVLVQADEGVEIVFVDDASTDGSPSILAQLLTSHPHRVRVLRHDRNKGISAARNTLLHAAHGNYIWFIDSDDLLEPNAISELKAIVQATSPDLIMCDFKRFESEASRYLHSRHIASFQGPQASRQRDRDTLLTGLFKSGQLHPWSKVIRATCWPPTLRFPVGRIFEDLTVYPRLALHVETFVHAPKTWVAYRQRPGSALSELSEKHIEDWMEALVDYPKDLTQWASELVPDTQFEIAHFCTRTFVRAAKRQSRLKKSVTSDWLPRFVDKWQRSSPLSYPELLKIYFIRGYWLRALQLAYWMYLVKKP
jgi:glycosyltransferase involved in cell wall biosynthesis